MPRVALVDHSTISAVQRLLGQIQIYDLSVIDSDLVALESFIEGILLFESIVCVDDYKAEFRARRSSNFPFISFENEESDSYKQADKFAREYLEEFYFKVKSGEVATDVVRKALEEMQYKLIFAWQMTSSEFYLHARILSGYGERSAEVSNTISSAISQIHFEKHLDVDISKISFHDGDGRDVQRESHGDEKGLDWSADAAASSINWLTFRSAFYTAYGALKGYHTCVHPIRSSFLYAIAQSQGLLSNATESKLIKYIGQQGAATLIDIRKFSDPGCVALDLPWFTAWVAANAKRIDSVIEIAFSLRDEPALKSLRKRLDELEEVRTEGDQAKFTKIANKIVSQIQSAAHDVKALYGLSNLQGVSTSGIALAANVASSITATPLPSVPKITLPGFGVPERLRLAFGFRAIFRRMVDDLVQVSRLGALHTKLTSGIRMHPKAHPREVFKREDPKYRYSHSHWKRPMT
jgi:hypothetical protein